MEDYNLLTKPFSWENEDDELQKKDDGTVQAIAPKPVNLQDVQGRLDDVEMRHGVQGKSFVPTDGDTAYTPKPYERYDVGKAIEEQKLYNEQLRKKLGFAKPTIDEDRAKRLANVARINSLGKLLGGLFVGVHGSKSGHTIDVKDELTPEAMKEYARIMQEKQNMDNAWRIKEYEEARRGLDEVLRLQREGDQFNLGLGNKEIEQENKVTYDNAGRARDWDEKMAIFDMNKASDAENWERKTKYEDKRWNNEKAFMASENAKKRSFERDLLNIRSSYKGGSGGTWVGDDGREYVKRYDSSVGKDVPISSDKANYVIEKYMENYKKGWNEDTPYEFKDFYRHYKEGEPIYLGGTAFNEALKLYGGEYDMKFNAKAMARDYINQIPNANSFMDIPQSQTLEKKYKVHGNGILVK